MSQKIDRRQFLWLVAAIGSTAIGAEHYVQLGETLSSIGGVYRIRWQDIAEANGIENPDSIKPGQKLKIPERKKEKHNEVISPPVNKELEEEIDYLVKEKVIAKWEIPATRGILYTQAAELDKILTHYKQNPKIFHDIMSQESGYKIESIGKDGERGTAQILRSTADSLAERVSNEKDPLHYPGFNKEGYKFENLSIDYKLNNILKAAYSKDSDDKMEKKKVNKNELFKKLKSEALKLNYEKFGKTEAEKENIKKRWEEQAENYKDTLVFYLYYNAGGKINDGTIYRMGLLMENANDYRAIREKVFKALKERPLAHPN